MAPRIVSIGCAVPEMAMTQEEVLRRLGYTSPMARRIFSRAMIEKRHFWVDPIGKDPDELRKAYERGVVELGCRAIEDCLDGRGLGSLGCLVFVSTTCPRPFTPGPAHLIAAELGLPSSVVLINEIGGGCQGAIPGLFLASLYVRCYGRPAIALSVELSSTTFFPSSEDDLEQVVSNAIFADAASCALVEPSGSGEFPEILGFSSRFEREHLHVTGYGWENGRLRVILKRELPRLVPPLMRATVDSLLREHGLTREDVSGYVLHNGGVSVLDSLAREFGVDGREAFRHSWEVLREFGNCSSATVGLVAKRFHKERKGSSGFVVGAAMGAGAEVSACLVRYGG